MDETLLERIFRALHRETVRYAVFGGVALNLHGGDAEELRRRFGLGEKD